MRLSRPEFLIRMEICWALLFLAAFCSAITTGCGSGSPSECKPCEHPELWPLSVASDKFPFIVHYRSDDELAVAGQVVGLLEAAWENQINVQGYTPPPSDEGMCGPDGRFDVFIWKGINTCQVDIISEKFVTAWGGRASYMKLDPWGDYGGAMLPQTVGHEFNHATHAANDWYETLTAFEMSASYVEQFYGPAVTGYAKDFQGNADWGLLRDDGYDTWYMYGTLLYLHFLRDFYFNGDDGFLPQLWVAVRNTPDLYVNKPHFVDGLNSILNPLGATFEDSLISFARWRYYAGIRDDGKHFRRLPTATAQLAFIPEATLPIKQIVLSTLTHKISPAPMLTGNAYLEIMQENAAQTSFQVAINTQNDPGVRWAVQAVPGLNAASDGDIVYVSSGLARVSFAPNGKRTLIFTVVPVMGFDPNHQTDARYPVSVSIAP